MATVGGRRANSRTQAASCGRLCLANLVMDQDQVVVAASLEQTAGIAVRMALDGATVPLQIVRHALAASMLLPALQCAMVTALGLAQRPAPLAVVVASGALIVAIAATMVQVGATSPAPIVQRAQACLTAAPLSQHAVELRPGR